MSRTGAAGVPGKGPAGKGPESAVGNTGKPVGTAGAQQE